MLKIQNTNETRQGNKTKAGIIEPKNDSESDVRVKIIRMKNTLSNSKICELMATRDRMTNINIKLIQNFDFKEANGFILLIVGSGCLVTKYTSLLLIGPIGVIQRVSANLQSVQVLANMYTVTPL